MLPAEFGTYDKGCCTQQQQQQQQLPLLESRHHTGPVPLAAGLLPGAALLKAP